MNASNLEDIFRSVRESQENIRRLLEKPVVQLPPMTTFEMPLFVNTKILQRNNQQGLPDLSSLLERQSLQKANYHNQIDVSLLLEGRTLQQTFLQNWSDFHLPIKEHNFLPANHQNQPDLSALLQRQGLNSIDHSRLPDLRWVESLDTHHLASAKNRTDEHGRVMGLAAASAIVLLVLLSLL